MIKKNVLLTSAGVTTAINVILALRKSKKYDCRIIATDMNDCSAGLYLADNFHITPDAKSNKFFNKIIAIIKKEKIDYIFPLHSSEIELFANKVKLLKSLVVGVTTPDTATVRLCKNKSYFVDFLKKNEFPHPKIYKNISDVERYPVFIKFKIGSSSKGAKKVNSQEELVFYLKDKEDEYVIQEFIDWKEITVDCYVNKNKKLVGFVPRHRVKVKDGKSIVAKTLNKEPVFSESKRLLESLDYQGACNIQMFYREGKFKIIEVNPRLSAGGLPLTIEAGVNIPELMMTDYFEGLPDYFIDYKENLTMYRYLTEVFR